MSDDHSGSTPKIEFHSLERIGRELRGMYEKLAQEPLPENLRWALHGIEDAESGLSQLREAAQALRHADEPRPGRIRSAARRAATAWQTSASQSAKGR
jgi:hypothetical protein